MTLSGGRLARKTRGLGWRGVRSMPPAVQAERRLYACVLGGILRNSRQPNPRLLRAKQPPKSVIFGEMANTCFDAYTGENPSISGSTFATKWSLLSRKGETRSFPLLVKRGRLRANGAPRNPRILLLAGSEARGRQPS